LTWNSGQVEGQVNKLKLIKRMGYGRAKFDCSNSGCLRHSERKKE